VSQLLQYPEIIDLSIFISLGYQKMWSSIVLYDRKMLAECINGNTTQSS